MGVLNGFYLPTLWWGNMHKILDILRPLAIFTSCVASHTQCMVIQAFFGWQATSMHIGIKREIHMYFSCGQHPRSVGYRFCIGFIKIYIYILIFFQLLLDKLYWFLPNYIKSMAFNIIPSPQQIPFVHRWFPYFHRGDPPHLSLSLSL